MNELDTILENDVSTRALKSAEALLVNSKFTTTALYALASIHDEADDSVGAELIREFAKKFAIHEASTL